MHTFKVGDNVRYVNNFHAHIGDVGKIGVVVGMDAAYSVLSVKFPNGNTQRYSTINFELVEAAPEPEEYLVSNGTSFKSIADAEKHLLSMGVNKYKISKVVKKVEVVKIVRDLE